MLKGAALYFCLMILTAQAAQAQTAEKEPPFRHRHPILYWSVAGPTYPIRHPKKTLDGLCFPIVHPCQFGKMYEGSGVSGTVNFAIQAGTAAGIYLMRM